MKGRKGLTPVIAIVLLLMMTVGLAYTANTMFTNIVTNIGTEQEVLQNLDLDINEITCIKEGATSKVLVSATNMGVANINGDEVQIVVSNLGTKKKYTEDTEDLTNAEFLKKSTSGDATIIFKGDAFREGTEGDLFSIEIGFSKYGTQFRRSALCVLEVS